ncbi:MAG: LON peptidase substrate-binding domain-containing protein [Candidatus Thiodiazotropha taylori]|nr:LON peptidase substrate-binding domain-containing protein [Candidatus Thiodiazotropha taylori]
MKPKYPFTQNFDDLPDQIPIFSYRNALLPGGELPLEISKPDELLLFFKALRSDQLIGIVQPNKQADLKTYQIGCAGRIRQYRERKDGRLNVMLTGVCRFRIIDEPHQSDSGEMARVNWRDFANDYLNEEVEKSLADQFKQQLRLYFDRHNMQVDWKVLSENPIEQVVNNLVLVVNLDVNSKQLLLESPTVTERLKVFTQLLEEKEDPAVITPQHSGVLN